MKLPDVFIGKRLMVGEGEPEELGRGKEEIRGSAYVEGPLHVGDSGAFPKVSANVMLAKDTNGDSPRSDRTLHMKGNANIEGDDRYHVLMEWMEFLDWRLVEDHLNPYM